jgi:hypothetical protein
MWPSRNGRMRPFPGRCMHRPADRSRGTLAFGEHPRFGQRMRPPEQRLPQMFFRPPMIMCTPGRSAGDGAW